MDFWLSLLFVVLVPVSQHVPFCSQKVDHSTRSCQNTQHPTCYDVSEALRTKRSTIVAAMLNERSVYEGFVLIYSFRKRYQVKTIYKVLFILNHAFLSVQADLLSLY